MIRTLTCSLSMLSAIWENFCGRHPGRSGFRRPGEALGGQRLDQEGMVEAFPPGEGGGLRRMTPTLMPVSPCHEALATTLDCWRAPELLGRAAAAVDRPAPMAGQAPPAAAAPDEVLELPELLFPHAVRSQGKARAHGDPVVEGAVLRIHVPFRSLSHAWFRSRAGTENVVGDNIRMFVRLATTYSHECAPPAPTGIRFSTRWGDTIRQRPCH